MKEYPPVVKFLFTRPFIADFPSAIVFSLPSSVLEGHLLNGYMLGRAMEHVPQGTPSHSMTRVAIGLWIRPFANPWNDFGDFTPTTVHPHASTVWLIGVSLPVPTRTWWLSHICCLKQFCKVTSPVVQFVIFSTHDCTQKPIWKEMHLRFSRIHEIQHLFPYHIHELPYHLKIPTTITIIRPNLSKNKDITIRIVKS